MTEQSNHSEPPEDDEYRMGPPPTPEEIADGNRAWFELMEAVKKPGMHEFLTRILQNEEDPPTGDTPEERAFFHLLQVYAKGPGESLDQAAQDVYDEDLIARNSAEAA